MCKIYVNSVSGEGSSGLQTHLVAASSPGISSMLLWREKPVVSLFLLIRTLILLD
jgi:hypothetical protein